MRLDVDVNTSGQMVTQAEREYWDAELAGFERAVATGELRTAEITGAAEEIASSGKKIISGQVVQILAGAVVTLVMAVILSRCRF